jgi:hypothetical protein
MRSWIVIGLAFAAALCGVGSAYLWIRSTKVRPEPKGFEPVLSELKAGWWQLAEWEASTRSGQFNSQAAWLAGAGAIFGFISAAVGLWLN